MLPRGFLRKCLAETRLKNAQRQVIVEHFAFGSPDWKTLHTIDKLRELPPSQDPVVLALRREHSGDLTGLRAAHRFAAENATARAHGFLHLVLAEAIAAPDELPASTELRILPLYVVFSLVDSCLSAEDPERAALVSRALAEVARRLIRKGDAFWRSVMIFAWSEQSRASADLELNATLFETLALGRELQGRLREADQAFVAALLALDEVSLPGRLLETLASHSDFLTRTGLAAEKRRPAR